jgi:hypothetical protein
MAPQSMYRLRHIDAGKPTYVGWFSGGAGNEQLGKDHGPAWIEGCCALFRGVGVLSNGVPNGSNCWIVNFSDGRTNNNNCDNDNAVRLVRSGE